MTKPTAAEKAAKKTSVEKTAEQLVDETNAELNVMPTVGDVQPEEEGEQGEGEAEEETESTDAGVQAAGFGEFRSDEEEFCKLFGLESCSQLHLDALAKAKRLLAVSPNVTIAALLLGMTNLPE